MAPPPQSKPAVKPAVTFRSKPRKGEVKVSVINIRCPFSDILRPSPQTNSWFSAHGPQTRRNQAVSNTGTLMTGSCLNRECHCRRPGSSAHRPIGHPPRLRPLGLAGVSESALKECLIIRPLHKHIKKTPDNPAAL